MTANEMKAMLETLAAGFTRAPQLTPKFLDVLFSKVRHVPASFISGILDRLGELESFPSNPSLAILRAYRDLGGTDSQPERKLGCPECIEGTIRWYVRKSGDSLTTGVALCPFCRPGQKHVASREELRSRGFWVPPAGEQADREWWSRYTRHVAARLKARNEGGPLDASALLADFTTMSQAAAERPANRPSWSDPG